MSSLSLSLVSLILIFHYSSSTDLHTFWRFLFIRFLFLAFFPDFSRYRSLDSNFDFVLNTLHVYMHFQIGHANLRSIETVLDFIN